MRNHAHPFAGGDQRPQISGSACPAFSTDITDVTPSPPPFPHGRIAQLLLARVDLIAMEKKCPPDTEESARTVIWAVPRLHHVDEMKVRLMTAARWARVVRC